MPIGYQWLPPSWQLLLGWAMSPALNLQMIVPTSTAARKCSKSIPLDVVNIKSIPIDAIADATTTITYAITTTSTTWDPVQNPQQPTRSN